MKQCENMMPPLQTTAGAENNYRNYF